MNRSGHTRIWLVVLQVESWTAAVRSHARLCAALEITVLRRSHACRGLHPRSAIVHLRAASGGRSSANLRPELLVDAKLEDCLAPSLAAGRIRREGDRRSIRVSGLT